MFPAYPGPDLEKMFLFSREMAAEPEEENKEALISATLPLSGYDLCPVAVPAEETPQWPKSSKCCAKLIACTFSFICMNGPMNWEPNFRLSHLSSRFMYSNTQSYMYHHYVQATFPQISSLI